MASVGHIAVGLAAGRYLAPRVGGSRLKLGVGLAVASFAPDLDVIAFRLGIPYDHPFGHRGATHALLVGVLVGVLVGAAVRWLEGRDRRVAVRFGVVVALVWMSHGVLDAMTTGGLGPALLWPLSDTRIFLDWRPIPVAPIGRAYFSPRGLAVALEEIVWFVPLLVYAAWPLTRPRASAASSTATADMSSST